jgi:sulfur-oxidizing protein SoxY
MRTIKTSSIRRARRSLLMAGAALVAARALPARSATVELPSIKELDQWLAGRAVRAEWLTLEVPRLADNGNAVPLKLKFAGPFAPQADVKSIRLYSERNPVALMARFDFATPPPRIEIDTRIRLAGTQRIAAVAELANGTLYAATADISVTVSACLDGT